MSLPLPLLYSLIPFQSAKKRTIREDLRKKENQEKARGDSSSGKVDSALGYEKVTEPAKSDRFTIRYRIHRQSGPTKLQGDLPRFLKPRDLNAEGKEVKERVNTDNFDHIVSGDPE